MKKDIFKQPGFYGTIICLYSLCSVLFDLPCHIIVAVIGIVLIWAESGFETIFDVTDEDCEKIANKVAQKITKN